MINIEIISRKLLFISLFISVLILLFLYLLSNIREKPLVIFCNVGNKINILIQTKQLDILVNPVGEKETLECLGKNISFYDRTIEIVMSNNNALVGTLKQRYTISHLIHSASLKIDNLDIVIDSNITLSNEKNSMHVYQQLKDNIQSVVNNEAISIQVQNEKLSSIENIKNKNIYIKENQIKIVPLSFF